MKDDCYVISTPKTGPIEIMLRGGELWFDIKHLPETERRQMFDCGEELAFEPSDNITYVRASFYARVWPEIQVLANNLARRLGAKLPWPEN